MGFGLIFLGYVTLLFFKILPPAMIAGAYLMFRGLKKLVAYNKPFDYASKLSAALGVYFAVYTAFWIADLSGISRGLISKSAFAVCDDIVYYALLLAFHVFMYKALEDISRQCEYAKGIKRAYMSRVLMSMFYALTVANLPFSVLKINTYLPLACLICEIVWILYTLVFLYGCYMRIATEEIIMDEERKLREYDEKYSLRRKKK